jgi:hypothetical protein
MSETKEAPRKTAAPPPTPAPAAQEPAPVPPAVAAPPPPPPPPRHTAPLPENRISLSNAAEGNIGNLWTAKIPKGMPWEDVLSDWLWANRAKDMKPGDMIHVIEDTMVYSGWLLVQQTRIVGPGIVPNRVSVVEELFRRHVLPDAQTNLDGMFTSYEGLHKKWCVMQRGKPDPIREGYDSQPDAERERRNLAATRTEPRRPDSWHG